jgi:hypothetical protein
VAPAAKNTKTYAGKRKDRSPREVEFTVAEGDIKSYGVDVVAIKYSRDFWGLDKAVTALAKSAGVSPAPGEYAYIPTKGRVRAPHALFVGVPPIGVFSYPHVRKFAARALRVLAAADSAASSMALTIHGASAGMDETETALSLFAGVLDAMRAGRLPPAMERIVIVEHDARRVARLRKVFDHALKTAECATRVAGRRWAYRLTVERKRRAPQRSVAMKGGAKKGGGKGGGMTAVVRTRPARRRASAGAVIEKAGKKAKPSVFVAMPFKKEMDNTYYYGIETSVHAIGYACERMDKDFFVGDIMERMRAKIDTSKLVIADLTGDNPNVLLEVGYAWGRSRPTVLVVRGSQRLCFDVQGQRYIKYDANAIRSLEEALTRMLKALKKDGKI